MIMALSEDGLESRERFQLREINVARLFKGRSDGLIDVEVAAGVDRIGIEEFLEDDERPALELVESLLERAFGYFWKAGAQQSKARGKAGALLEKIDNRDGSQKS